MKRNDPPIIVSVDIQATTDAVWVALTDPSIMQQWFFEEITKFKAESGFETSFAVSVGERTFTHLWTILKVLHEESITYKWRYHEYQGDSRLTFTIREKDDLTNVEVCSVVTEDFPDDILEFTRESCQAGWQYFLNERLKPFLEGSNI